ncbi:16917_t:CDS:2, partial [Dentiscutata erythropus]
VRPQIADYVPQFYASLIGSCWENYNKDIKDIRDDKIKQAIIQFRNSDKELQKISIQPTVQHSEAYFTSRTINLSETNRIITGLKKMKKVIINYSVKHK